MVKHGIVVSDLHTGHLVGLTPPDWQLRPPKGSPTKREKFYKINAEMWDSFDANLQKLPKLDFILTPGDLVEGKGERSGGVELLLPSVQEQCIASAEVFNHIRRTRGKKNLTIIGAYGTDYHVSTLGEDWENDVAERAGFTKIGSHEWVNINGCVFDIKHHLGSSSVPHGRFTQIAKENLWNILWAERDLQARANVIFRGHVHYHGFCGTSDWIAMTLPALQGMGSRYGSRRCTGLVDWGFLHVWITEKGEFNWEPYVVRLKAQKAPIIEV